VIERNLTANSVKTTGFYPLGIMFLSFNGSKATIIGTLLEFRHGGVRLRDRHGPAARQRRGRTRRRSAARSAR
jgi:hypothetical protein